MTSTSKGALERRDLSLSPLFPSSTHLHGLLSIHSSFQSFFQIALSYKQHHQSASVLQSSQTLPQVRLSSSISLLLPSSSLISSSLLLNYLSLHPYYAITSSSSSLSPSHGPHSIIRFHRFFNTTSSSSIPLYLRHSPIEYCNSVPIAGLIPCCKRTSSLETESGTGWMAGPSSKASQKMTKKNPDRRKNKYGPQPPHIFFHPHHSLPQVTNLSTEH